MQISTLQMKSVGFTAIFITYQVLKKESMPERIL